MNEYLIIVLFLVFGVFMLFAYRLGYKSATHEPIVEKKLEFPQEDEIVEELEKLDFPQD